MRRRNTTTEFLKECMADALLKLLNEKPMEEITISEITDTADVARVTFYRHFNSKEDLLYFKCKLMGERWNNSLTDEQRSDPVFLAESFFQMTDSMKELLLTLHHANLHHIVLLAVHQEMRRDIDESIEDDVYSAAFLSFGMYGILTEWMNGGCKKKPQELAALTLKNIKII